MIPKIRERSHTGEYLVVFVMVCLIITYATFGVENGAVQRFSQLFNSGIWSTKTKPNLGTCSGPIKSTPSVNGSRSVYRPTNGTDRYAAFGGVWIYVRGLGNMMFDVAALLYVAQLSGRVPTIKFVKNHNTSCDKAFDLSVIKRLPDYPCPCYSFSERYMAAYDERVEALGQPWHNTNSTPTIAIHGLYQSWKYLKPIEATIRHYFTFRTEIRQFAEAFLRSSCPPGWTSTQFVRIAVHSRRGDYTSGGAIATGLTTADPAYFQRAMTFMVRRHGPRVQFIVSSDDSLWMRQNIVLPVGLPRPDLVNVTYVPSGHTAAQDMAIMALCDHMILSTGTYGWWAAWLGGGMAVYYKNFPAPGSQFAGQFVTKDYYPPDWIAM